MGRNRWVAAFLSLVVGGLGHAYLGLWGRALFFFALEVASAAAYTEYKLDGLFYINVLVGALAMADAYYLAKHTKRDANEPQSQQQPEIRVF